jgi:DNA-binding transcriptional regulator YiaG
MESKEEVYQKIVQYIELYEQLNQKKLDNKLKYLISARVKLHRVQNNLTQDQLAKKLNVQRLQILRWENGQSYPTREKIKFLQDYGILPDLS